LLLADYAEAGNEDRLYGDSVVLPEQEEYDFETAGAVLLGRDVADIVSPLSHTAIEAILKSEPMTTRLLDDIVRARSWLDENHATRCARLLEAFRRGFTERVVPQPGT
jgi:predicted nucleotidyltransferase